MAAPIAFPGNANLLIGEWKSRGYLPHIESPELVQHVTFHLADSLPADVLSRMEEEIRILPSEKQAAGRRTRLEDWIDAGHGSGILRVPEVASAVQRAILFFDGQRYRVIAWVVMPNHVHVLFQPINNWTVAKIVASWKKFTARKILEYQRVKNANREIGVPRDSRNAPVWHREYWDRFIRNERHFRQAVEYIHFNPVKAKLVTTAEDWPWSSAASAWQRTLGTPIS